MITYNCSVEPETRIKRVKFFIPSCDEIRKQSVVEITESTIYNRGLPAPGGLSDTRMGTVDRRILCSTCGLDVLHCQGHPGHIELPFPMFHSIFFETVLKTVRCICFMCSRLCLNEDEIPPLIEGLQGKQRLISIYGAAKPRKRCPHCGASRPNYVRNSMHIRAEWSNDDWESEEEKTFCKQIFSQRDTLSMLQNMTDEDCENLGFDPESSHPKNMVMQTLLVPPPSVRPTILASEGSKTRGQDDLTQKLQDIGKKSQDLRNVMAGTHWMDIKLTHDILEKIQKLQYEVFTLVSNTVRGQRPSLQRSGIPTKSYIGRIKGKDGRIRGNLMGKRVDFCARCVISPGPYLDLDQVGVPISIATSLTVPEIVTSENIVELTKRVRSGANCIEGAECVITGDGVVIHLAQCTARHKMVLLQGWTVERYIKDDDVVAFNRQPSLHKQGLMGHRVKIVDGMTFRMNLSVTGPYNADFDGDEMNLHVPQSLSSRTSVAMLMMVTDQLISPQANKPCMGIVQDGLIGLYRMSHSKVILDQINAAQLVCELKHTKLDKLPEPLVMMNGVPYWTGKQIVSSIFPSNLNIDRESSNDFDSFDINGLIIFNGQLLNGRLNKSCIGSGSGGVIDIICRQEGGMKTAKMMSDLQRIALAYNALAGFSVGISDCVLNEQGKNKVNERLSQATHLADEITREVGHEDIIPENADLAEQTIRRILSKALMQAGGIVEQSFDDTNAIREMVIGGSKGSPINLSQIGACVGQQSVEGRRISADKGSRTLPCFDFGEKSLQSQGFVQSSYVDGLNPSEFFFHAMGGREGLVDTAVKTSETGYIQRRQVKAMESHGVRYDGTVRNAADDIVQFIYAGSGYEPSRLERVKVDVLNKKNEDIIKEFPKKKEHERIMKYKSLILTSLIKLGCELDARLTLPVNPKRLKMRYITNNPGDSTKEAKELDDYIATLDNPTVKLALFYEFSESMMQGHQPQELLNLKNEIARLLAAAIVPAGEMVGCLAAQSIGEPTTQMTLNSVDWNTFMAIHWTGNTPPPAPHNAEVGMFIDTLIESHPNDVQLQPDGVTVYLPLPKGSAIALSPDEDGNMKWTELEAVTRHPPINKDGSNTLIKVTTESGREVIVTKGKSLLVEVNGKLVEMDGDKVKIGDRVPIVQELPETNIEYLNLHSVFAETEVVFTNTMLEAIEASKHGRKWFQHGGFKGRCRYKRSDTLLDAIKIRPQLTTPNMVAWPMGQSAMLPIEIPLDREFGFFIGAFLAEGALTDHQVHIANIDPTFREACKVWPERYGIKWHITNEKHQKKNNGTSISIMFHSTFLVNLLKRTCDKGSYNKRVPSFAMVAPKIFIEGLLDGYISGDGTLSKKQSRVSIPSRSRALRDGISLLLTKFKINTTFSEWTVPSHVKWTTNDDGSRSQEMYGEEKPVYSVNIGAHGAYKLAHNVTLTLKYKQEILNSYREPNMKKIKLYEEMQDVQLEEITSLEEISSTNEFVYDLTVAQTHNMCTMGGFGLYDTFHFSGVASKNVTLGIPRLKEILTVTKNIKVPNTTVRFKEPFAYDGTFAKYFNDTIPATLLCDIATSYDIINDPDPSSTIIESDKWMVYADHCLNDHTFRTYSRYIARVTLNRTAMHVRGITPPDVRRILKNRLGNKAHVISSETNEIDWIVRVRLFHVDEMVSFAKMNEERQAVVVHRIMSVLMQTLIVCGHVDVSASSTRVENVSKCIPSLGGYDVVTISEHVIDMNGVCFVDIAACPLVDFNRCYSNDVNEIQNILGISAAAEVLYQELFDVISFDGTYIFAGHLLMIVDTMTRDGKLKPLNRFGVNREHSNALARSSYEETPEVLTEAAIFAEDSLATGVSTNIILGQRADIGTGITKIKFHSNMLPARMRSSICTSAKLVKTVVRPKNSLLNDKCVDYANMDTDANIQNISSIEVPYSNEQISHMSSNMLDNMFSSGFQPPFEKYCDNEAQDFVVSHPFKFHTPENSDDED